MFYSIITISIIYLYKGFLIDSINKASYYNITHISNGIFMFCYMFIFRARPFPQYYHLAFEDPANGELVEPKEINIYQVDLPSIKELGKPNDYGKVLNNLTKKELKEIDKETEIPFVIVNPFVQDEKFCIMDHLMLANIPKDGK